MSSYTGHHSVELNENSIYQSGENPTNSNTDIVVHVIYTDLQGALAALQSAETLARQLQGRITLLAAHSVPYGLPITRPPVSLEFARQRLVDLTQQGKLQTSIQIYICRDRTLCLMQALYSKSLVVLGAKRRWWPTREGKLVKRLESAGHHIVLVEPAA
jgi:hypothetical protein